MKLLRNMELSVALVQLRIACAPTKGSGVDVGVVRAMTHWKG
jgi:hypothetical protein